MPTVREMLSHEGKDHVYEADQVKWEGGYEEHAEVRAIAYCMYDNCDSEIILDIDINFKAKSAIVKEK